jgi:HlyD family secretion protein
MDKRKSKRLIIIILLGALLIVLLLAVLYGTTRDTRMAVQTETVEPREIIQLVTASGRIQPETQVTISAEVSGEIVELPVREGQIIQRGDLIVRIRPDAYVAARNRAQAAFEGARADLRRADANLEMAQQEYRRMQELFAKQFVSESELISARTSYTVALAGRDASEHQVAQAAATLEEAKENLDRTNIYAPMSGTITKVNSELGERVVGTGMMGGTEILVISDLSRMEAWVDVDENDVVLISVADTARVEVDAYPARSFNGVVTEIAHAATVRGLGTQNEVVNFEVRIRILDSDIMLRPGMSMIADIETDIRPSALAVPIQSVTVRMDERQRESQSEANNGQRTRGRERPEEIVFVVENDAVKAVPVVRGIMGERYVEILEGIEEGMEIVTGSFRAINRDLRDGMAVRVDNTQRRDLAQRN